MITFYTCLLLSAFVQFSFTQNQESTISIEKLHVRSNIRHRYAVTKVTSEISNSADFAQDVKFDVQLPKEAFITDFSMLIDGVVYPGVIDKKAVADKKYDAAVSSGQSAGKIATASVRDSNEFVVSINVEANSTTEFNLTYHELLLRRTGLYEHVIYINPGSVVPDFMVQVFINESREITELTVPEIRGDRLSSNVISGTNKYATIKSLDAFSAEVTFAPTIQQQQEYSDSGVNGQFIVNYDVDHTLTPEGEILASNGYFVHFFAPDNLPALGKRIVFVLDVSGSMGGTKIRQLREAMLFILAELRPIDEFGIILFSSDVRPWRSAELISAIPENIKQAKAFIETIRASGGTNINSALQEGLRSLGTHPTKLSMVIFLTDGQATSGITSSDQIIRNVAEARLERQSIYSLAFGRGADFDIVQKISSEGEGFARKIYEDADASLQLAGFYNEISTPLLSDIEITYLNDTVDPTSVTVRRFPWYFSGSEIIVSGRFNVDSNNNGSDTEIPLSNGQRENIDVDITNNTTTEPLPLTLTLTGRKDIQDLTLKSIIHPPCFYPLERHYWPPYPCYCRPCPPFPPPKPPVHVPGPIKGRNDFIERLWVYLTIKQLLAENLENPTTATENKITELALKYKFVTPFTSMTVTKPERMEKPKLYFGESKVQSPQPQVSRRVMSPPSFNNFGVANVNFALGPAGPNTLSKFGQPLARPSRFPVADLRPPPPTTTMAPVKPLTSGLNIEVNLTESAAETSQILCLDIPASTLLGNLLLLNDTENGVVLTGVLHQSNYGDHKKFSELEISLGVTFNLKITTKDISLNGVTYPWWRLNSLAANGLRVTANDGIEVTSADNVMFTFHKFGLETRRSLSSPFIALTIQNMDYLSVDAEGIIATILDLDGLQIENKNTIKFFRNGVTEIATTTTDSTLENKNCYRVKNEQTLASILGS